VAQAEKPNLRTIKTAKFKASLSGSQVTTWEYHTPKDDDPCTAQVDSYGDQTVKFDSKRRKVFNVSFSTPPKNDHNFFSTAGRPQVLIEPIVFNLHATADRNGERNVDPGSTSGCQGDNGGGVDPGDESKPDCGRREGSISPHLFFYDTSADDDLFVPLTEDLASKNRLKLEGRSYDWQKPGGEDSSDSLEATYERCPMDVDSYLEEAGHIYTSPAKIAEKRLFNRKRKHIVISGHHIVKHNKDGVTGQTILAWNLRLTRIK
jgi:hypothetical protein